MKGLVLPPTVRHLQFEEAPKGFDFEEYENKCRQLNLIEGYRSTLVADALYTYFAEINIDNDRLFDLFKALVVAIPQNELGLIIGEKDEEPIFLPYEDKYRQLNRLTAYKDQLCKDGFVEFGLMYGDDEYQNEVFIKSFKYVQVWGNGCNRQKVGCFE